MPSASALGGPSSSSATSGSSSHPSIPSIKHIFPAEGWCQGGGTAILIGDNFHDGLQVHFGNTVAWSEVITQQAIKTNIPARANAGAVDVVLSSPKGILGPKVRSNPVRFTFVSLTEPNIDYGFQRLQKLLPKYPNDPERLSKEIILRRAADLAEALYNRYGTPVEQLSHYAAAYPFDSDLVADYARTHGASPRALYAAGQANAMAAAGLASTAAAAYVPYSNGSAAAAAANFLNSPAVVTGFSPFGNPFALQTLQKPGAY